MDDSAHRPVPRGDSVLAVIDGSRSDEPLLRWAAEEASQTGRGLLIAYAAGHLPPDLTFAERHVAVERRRDAGRRVVDRAVGDVLGLAPDLEIATVIRLLSPDLLLSTVGTQAPTASMSGAGWGRRPPCGPGAPVLAVLGAADHAGRVVGSAREYAERRGLGLRVLEGVPATELPARVREASSGSSLVFLSGPGPREVASGRAARALGWPLVLTVSARSRSPVVLVVGAPGSASSSRAG